MSKIVYISELEAVMLCKDMYYPIYELESMYYVGIGVEYKFGIEFIECVEFKEEDSAYDYKEQLYSMYIVDVFSIDY